MATKKSRAKSKQGAKPAFDVASFVPSQAELSENRPLFDQLSHLLEAGARRIQKSDVDLLLVAIRSNGVVEPAELWLLWKTFSGNEARFEADAARVVRDFLEKHGVKG